MGFSSVLTRTFGFVADLVFVPLCPVCREPAKNGACPECQKRLDAAFSPCEFFRREMEFDAGISAFDFRQSDVRALVYCLKRRGTKNSLVAAGDAIYRAVSGNPDYLSADLITWVPRDKKALRRFGFDQARLLAEYLSSRCRKEAKQLVFRTGKAKMQKTLDVGGRRLNVKNKFICPEKVFGGEVILIDDMVTSGATVNEVSRELKEAGFDKVFVLSLASADTRSAPKEPRPDPDGLPF